MSKSMIGIVGGVGPAAGLDLFQKIINNTFASKDNEHLPVVLASVPHLIGDRTEFLLGHEKKNPAKGILKVIRKLESAGANIIGIPCNTAHAPQIFDVVIKNLNREKSGLVIVNMVNETVDYIKKHYPDIGKIGVLATIGSYKTELYKSYFDKRELIYIVPNSEFQNRIHDAIYNHEYGIKAISNPVSSKSLLILNDALQHLITVGAEAVILGCTEISFAMASQKCSVPLIDPANILARKLIKLCDKTKLREN